MPLVIDDFAHSRRLVGAPRRDAFKAAHKVMLGGGGYYASDVDLALVAKAPEGIVAFLDCKQPGELLSMAEVLAYNALLVLAPIYVVEVRDAWKGPFRIHRYRGGDHRPRPPEVQLEAVTTCVDWPAFKRWEAHLRWGRSGVPA